MVLGEYSFALLSTVVGVAYPFWQSFTALKTGSASEWLPYWLVFVLFTTLGSPLDWMFSAWVPLWYEMKLGIIVALQPQTVNLAKSLYDTKLEPAMLQLDEMLTNDERLVAIQAGLNRFYKMSLQEKWTFLKTLDFKNTVQTAQAACANLASSETLAFVGTSLKSATHSSADPSTSQPEPGTLPVTPRGASPEESMVDAVEELSTVPEPPSSPDQRSGGSDAEIIEPEDAPLPPPAIEPLDKKTQ